VGGVGGSLTLMILETDPTESLRRHNRVFLSGKYVSGDASKSPNATRRKKRFVGDYDGGSCLGTPIMFFSEKKGFHWLDKIRMTNP